MISVFVIILVLVLLIKISLYTALIGFNPRRLQGLKGDELPRNGPYSYLHVCGIFFSSSSPLLLRYA